MYPLIPLTLLASILTAFASPEHGTEATTAEVAVHPDRPGITIPADFMGLSYEKSALTEQHFRPDNGPLINLHRNLGESVLRIGGNKVELCRWQPEQSFGSDSDKLIAVTPDQVTRFLAFVRAIGWNVIYGVNLAGNDPVNSAEEISHVSKSAGKSVVAFEVGNEPDHYYLPPKKTFRPQGYSYVQYRHELDDALRVIIARNPGIPLAGPANTAGGNKEWFEPCLEDFKGKLALATSHFYPTTNKKPYPTPAKLLSPETSAKSAAMAETNMAVARKAGMPWRLAECNSTSLGGTAGVSDVCAAAVWGSDFLFDIAECGVAGINFHTILGTNAYTAIAYDKNTRLYSVRPLYHALLLFKDAGRGQVLPVETKSGANVTAHATLGEDGKTRIVVINKDLTRDVTATILTGTDYHDGTVGRLQGKSPFEQEGVSYAGMTVTSGGNLTPPRTEAIKGRDGRFEIPLPACSAVVLTLGAN